MKNTQHLSMSIAMLEEETVEVNVRLNQAVRQVCQNIVRCNYEVPVT